MKICFLIRLLEGLAISIWHADFRREAVIRPARWANQVQLAECCLVSASTSLYSSVEISMLTSSHSFIGGLWLCNFQVGLTNTNFTWQSPTLRHSFGLKHNRFWSRGWASFRSRLLLMFEVDRREDEIRKVRTRCYRRKVRSWAFKLELSFLLSDIVSQSWKLNPIFRHCVVWRWKSMYTRIDVATRSWMLFANIECWHTTLIFGGDCTPYSFSNSEYGISLYLASYSSVSGLSRLLLGWCGT